MKTPLAQIAFWTRARLRIVLKLSPSVSPGVLLEDTCTQALSMESNVSAPQRLNLALPKSLNLIARNRVPETVRLISPNISQRIDYLLQQLMTNVGKVIA
jgi:hypothetical protein